MEAIQRELVELKKRVQTLETEIVMMRTPTVPPFTFGRVSTPELKSIEARLNPRNKN